MSASQIHLVVGDTAPPLSATLANAAGPQDLTGATVVARLKRSTDGEVVQVTMDIDADPTTGVVTHDWDPTETDEVLKYTVEFVATFANGKVETFPNESSDVPTIAIRARKTAA
jgi:ketosteroid isomerase-like protein